MISNFFVSCDETSALVQGNITIECSVLSDASGLTSVRTLRVIIPNGQEDKINDQKYIEGRFARLLFEVPLAGDTNAPMKASLTIKDARQFGKVLSYTFDVKVSKPERKKNPVTVEILNPPPLFSVTKKDVPSLLHDKDVVLLQMTTCMDPKMESFQNKPLFFAVDFETMLEYFKSEDFDSPYLLKGNVKKGDVAALDMLLHFLDEYTTEESSQVYDFALTKGNGLLFEFLDDFTNYNPVWSAFRFNPYIVQDGDNDRILLMVEAAKEILESLPEDNRVDFAIMNLTAAIEAAKKHPGGWVLPCFD